MQKYARQAGPLFSSWGTVSNLMRRTLMASSTATTSSTSTTTTTTTASPDVYPHSQALLHSSFFRSSLPLRRTISNRSRIVRSQVLRKVKKEVERLPSQGRDPADSFQHGWRHASAIMLERYPVIIPEQHEFEHEYLKGRFLAQQKESIPIPMELFLTDRDIVEGRKEPNFRDPVAEQYTPAPRTTNADARNDTKSLNRALDERLYLVVKTGGSGSAGGRDQKKSSEKTAGKFRFPQMLADDENVPLWEYASRAFQAITKPDLVVSSSPTSSVTMKNNQDRVMIHFISARPCCHLEHVYPLAYQKRHDVYGVKIFFYKAVLLQGILENYSQLRSNVVSDFHWARESELEHMLGSDYYQWIEPALVGVGPSNDFKV